MVILTVISMKSLSVTFDESDDIAIRDVIEMDIVHFDTKSPDLVVWAYRPRECTE